MSTVFLKYPGLVLCNIDYLVGMTLVMSITSKLKKNHLYGPILNAKYNTTYPNKCQNRAKDIY